MTKESEIWEKYKRVVAPVRKRRKTAAAKLAPDKSAARKSAEKAPAAVPKTNVVVARQDVTLERKREKSLRQGEIIIDARLDLHGMTQAQAFERLAGFMTASCKAGKRCLLIITGKGRGGQGVLRGNFEKWLGQLPEAKTVLAVRPSAPKHGGDGAFYVLLRKG